MRNIPMEYTIDVLKTLECLQEEQFVDSWYVPVEEHIDKKNWRTGLKK